MGDATKPDEATLFAKASPDLFKIVLPVRWAWHYVTRRVGLLSLLASTWNDHEPTAVQLADGFLFGEGPRFRIKENALYFSDMYGKKVYKYELTTEKTSTVFEHDDFVSGLGWLPDETMLVVDMNARRILSLDPTVGKAETYADVSAVTRFRANDFVVDVSGRAYVGNFGFDFSDTNNAATTTVVRIDTDKSVHVATKGMFFPNGSVITPDGKTLIVGETYACQLTAFDIAADGSLSNRRVWADVGMPVDGIALDAEGCVWVAVPHVGIHATIGALVRVREGGEIVNLYGFGQNGVTNSVFACQLGTDAATGTHFLFFLEAPTSHDSVILKDGPEKPRRDGVLKAIPVPVGPARIPGNDRYCGGYC